MFLQLDEIWGESVIVACSIHTARRFSFFFRVRGTRRYSQGTTEIQLHMCIVKPPTTVTQLSRNLEIPVNLFGLDWLDHQEINMQRKSSKADVTTCIFARNSRTLNACIPGAAECDFDVCKNVLRSILRLHATSGGQLNANRL